MIHSIIKLVTLAYKFWKKHFVYISTSHSYILVPIIIVEKPLEKFEIPSAKENKRLTLNVVSKIKKNLN